MRNSYFDLSLVLHTTESNFTKSFTPIHKPSTSAAKTWDIDISTRMAFRIRFIQMNNVNNLKETYKKTMSLKRNQGENGEFHPIDVKRTCFLGAQSPLNVFPPQILSLTFERFQPSTVSTQF